jgi:hypothetical protein
MKGDLVARILEARAKTTGKNITEAGLRPTLTRIKRRKNLRSVEQAACYYILKCGLDINVSSVIDDVTRAAIADERRRATRGAEIGGGKKGKATKGVGRVPHEVKWLGEHYYSLATALADFYPYLFIYENALRQEVNAEMEKTYPNWWETKIKNELTKTYDYAKDRLAEQAALLMVGHSRELQPYERITLGHLQGIIEKYPHVFVPSVFPNLHFFTGHMVIILRVRHGIAHTSPALSVKDVRNAKHEMDILLQQFATGRGDENAA